MLCSSQEEDLGSVERPNGLLFVHLQVRIAWKQSPANWRYTASTTVGSLRNVSVVGWQRH